MDSNGLGLKDIPINCKSNESLGLHEYSEALVEFISGCETPMTIALQGDWGSGKTSLMNLIRNELFNEEKVMTIWFNTWQYSQFEMDHTLSLSMISHFIDSIEESDEHSKASETVKKITTFLTRGARAVGTAVTAQVTGDAGTMTAIENAAKGLDAMSPAHDIKNLKDQLEKMVSEREHLERIVVFIDDLDRLIPTKAVELLESLKLFLDIPKCVYVLAVDYKVIAQGLASKFGTAEAELKGKSFFDKIIQVPFNMPVAQYQAGEYLGKLLKKINIKYHTDDLEIYSTLVSYSSGFNPRGIKRLLNSLFLLRIVAEKKGIINSEHSIATEEEIYKILFATLCMQYSFEPMYLWLLDQTHIDDDFFNRARDNTALRNNSDFSSYLEGHNTLEKDHNYYNRLSQFMDTFYSAIQLQADLDDAEGEHLSHQEINNLMEIIKFSSVVSTDAKETLSTKSQRQANRAMATTIAQTINKQYKSEINRIKGDLTRGGAFVFQKRSTHHEGVQIRLVSHEMGLGFCYDEDLITVWFEPWKKKKYDYVMEWGQKNLFSNFPNFKIINDKYAELIRIKLDHSYSREDKVHEYENIISSSLKTIIPALVELYKKPENTQD